MNPNLPTTDHKYEKFLDQLSDKSLAIVYSYSNTIDKRRTWYDRWKSAVVLYFGQGAEALGLDVRYIDVDTYLAEMAIAGKFHNDYVLNLHSGLSQISSWPIISSLASWRNVPVGPCPSDVHITCERKDVTRAFAEQLGMQLPRKWEDGAQSECTFVIKERDLGMSVGLRKSDDTLELQAASTQSNLIVEEFISGYDATVAVIANSNDDYTIIGAKCCLPKGDNPHEWMFTEEIKSLPMSNSEYEIGDISVDVGVGFELKKISHMLGDGAIYRYDFRIKPLEDGSVPSVMTIENSWFLEVTPTPTMSEHNEFGMMMKAAVEDSDLLKDLVGESARRFTGQFAPQSVLVANLLYKAQSNLIQR